MSRMETREIEQLFLLFEPDPLGSQYSREMAEKGFVERKPWGNGTLERPYHVSVNDLWFVKDDEVARTTGLDGCYGIAVYARKGGRRMGALMHYGLMVVPGLYKKAIEYLVGKHPEMKGADVKKVLVFHADLCPDDMGRYDMLQYGLNSIEESTKQLLGPDAEVARRSYGMSDRDESKIRNLTLDLSTPHWESWMSGARFETLD